MSVVLNVALWSAPRLLSTDSHCVVFQAAAALAVDSFVASVRPGNGVPEVQVAQLAVLYSEGRLSQTLPDSMQALRGEAA